MSPIPGLSRYVLAPLREGTDFTLYRGRKHDTPSPVLAIGTLRGTAGASKPRAARKRILVRSRTRSRLAAKPLAITRHEGRTILLLKDPGGEPLDRILERDQGQPLDLTRFLRIAIGLATALGHAHPHGLLHEESGGPAYLFEEVAAEQNDA